MFTRFITCIVALSALIALCQVPAQAKDGHITNIEEKHKLIRERRPDEKNMRGAQGVLKGYSASEISVLNTMRVLGRGDVRLGEDPYLHGRLNIPPLGTLEANAEEQPDSWVLLRLVALLRAGYPGGTDLANELYAWLESAAPSRKHVWADVSLELLTIDALMQRTDRALLALREKAAKRGAEIIARRTWDLVPTSDPSLNQLVKMYHLLLSRRLAIKHGWGEAPVSEQAEESLLLLAETVRENRNPESELWFDAPKEVDSSYCRACLLIGAVLGLGIDDDSLPKKVATRCGSSLGYTAERLPDDLKDEDAWRTYEGDALALFLAGGEKFGKRAKPVRKAIERQALTEPRLSWSLPRPHNSHVAAQLRWVLCRSYGDPGMGRSDLSVEERDHVSAICLSLLAATGGLDLDAEPREPLEWGKGVQLFVALETLDLDDYYGYMETTDLAIDAAAAYLINSQQSDGTFMPGGFSQMLGGHGLALHALLDAGVDRNDPRMKKAFELMVDMVEKAVDPHTFGAFGQQNYCCSIAMMAFQSYYEPEIKASGMNEAQHPEEYQAAAQKVWSKIDKRQRELIGEISWRLSNADGFGWGYSLPEENRPCPVPVTPDQRDPNKEGKSPVTGEKAEKKQAHSEIENERRRRMREGRYPDRPATPPQGVRHADGSNSQYAVLGIKAGMMLGAPLDYKTLAWDAMRLIDAFRPSGYAERLIEPTATMTLDQLERMARDPRYADDSDPNNRRARPVLQPFMIGGWSYHANGSATWGEISNPVRGKDKDGNPIYAWPYSVGMTSAGISSLAILRDALMLAPMYDPVLIGKVDDRLAGGLTGLGQMYPYSRDYFKLDPGQSQCWIGGGEGRGMLYDMYGCERAGVLTQSVYFGDTEWYRDGADVMLREQGKDGGWPNLNKQVCNFSFALLFLKRSAPFLASQRPPKRTGPVTGK